MFLLHMIFIRIERNNQERHRSKPLDSNHQDQPLAIFTPFWKRNHQDRLMKRCSSYKLIRLVNLNFEHRFGSEKKTDFLEWNQVITMFIFFLKTEKENLLFPSSFYSREEPLSTKNKSSTEILKTIIDNNNNKKFFFFCPGTPKPPTLFTITPINSNRLKKRSVWALAQPLQKKHYLVCAALWWVRRWRWP